MTNKVKNIIQNVVLIILVLWQLFVWFQFAPDKYGDPYVDLAPMFYFLFGIPIGLLGIFLSFFLIRNKEIEIGRKTIAWILMIVSVCTTIPPLFLITRYIFYPLVNLLDKL